MTLTEELVGWSHERRCRLAVDSLEKNGFTSLYCASASEACDYILGEASDALTVGFGGSLSLADMGVAEKLGNLGKELLIHGAPGLTTEERRNVMRRQLTCDLFLTGANALTLSGRLVNIDATGNRAASMFFGPKKVIVVVGRNKLVDGTIDDAIRRIKSFASPANARRLGFRTPCAESGFCCDCESPERICRITVVIDRKPRQTDLRVVVVNEDMGL